MAVASPPEVPTTAPPPPPAPPSPPPTEHYAPQFTPPPPRRRASSVGGLILIALGLVALFSMWLPGGGAWLFLGLGIAFLAARVLTGHFGYAVPAGILLGFGSFVWVTEVGLVNGPAAGGLFFVFLGLGFLASYAIAARPEAVWPILPGVVLIGFGAFVQAMTFGTPFSQYWWLAQYWPLALVAVGVWVLLRDQIPQAARAPVAIIGASALILVGLLVAAAGMSMVAMPYARGPMPMPVPWTMFSGFGNAPYQDTVTLSAPVSGIDSVRLVNTSGTTLIRPTQGTELRVQATRHYFNEGQPPDVRLVANNGVLSLELTPAQFMGVGSYADYVIDAPAQLGADVRSASGSIAISGLHGPVSAESASGSIDARDLLGPASVRTTSGGIRLANIDGNLQVTSISGGISGAGVDRVTEARSTSGGINLTGAFANNAQIASVSGSVTLRLTPPASVHVDATSVSGDVNAGDLGMSRRVSSDHSLSGDVGTAASTISVHTTSGSIRVLPAS